MSDYRRNQAWNAGRRAFAAGKPIESNNRQPCTIFYDDWCDGWRAAQYAADDTAAIARATGAGA